MQEDVRQWAHKYCAANEGKDIPPPKDEDYGFHNPPEYVLDRYGWLVDYGVWPQAGGVDDQDETLLDDFRTLRRLIARVAHERREAAREADLMKHGG